MYSRLRLFGTANTKFKTKHDFYVVTLRRGRPREQLLLLNYKTQRHAVFLRDTLTIDDEGKQICSFVSSTEPLQVRYPHPKCENFNTLSHFSHSLLQGFFSYPAYMY